MEIYERIKNLRKERGLTAETVASAIGVSRATIYRYETKDIENMPISVLVPLSKVLCCTPGYLMGWEESPVKYGRESMLVDDTEKEIIHKFRALNNGERAMFLRTIGIEEKGDEEKMA